MSDTVRVTALPGSTIRGVRYFAEVEMDVSPNFAAHLTKLGLVRAPAREGVSRAAAEQAGPQQRIEAALGWLRAGLMANQLGLRIKVEQAIAALAGEEG